MSSASSEALSGADNKPAVLSGQVSVKKKKRRLTVLLLIVSVVAAVAFWLYVVSENNTVNGVQFNILGNERLMGENLSISSVEPSVIDVVLRGKSDQIRQIVADKSLVEAKVNIFKSTQETEGEGYCIFENESDAKVGTYTVKVEVILPNGVTYADKEVTVTITEIATKRIETRDIGHKITNYSLSPDCTLDSISFEQQWLTVSGDVKSVNSIASISVVSDWSKEISGDITIGGLVPIAYDSEGDEIDGRFLRFDPSVLQLNVSVNKSRTINLGVVTDSGDLAKYELSPSSVVVYGPIRVIDKLDGTYILNEAEFEAGTSTVASSYELRAEDIARSVSGGALFTDRVRILDLGGNEKSFVNVSVNRTESRKTAEIVIPSDRWIVLTDEGFDGSLESDYTVKVSYVSRDGKTPQAEDLLCLADLSGKGAGSDKVMPYIGLVDPQDYLEFSFDALQPVSVWIVATGQVNVPTPTETPVDTVPDFGE